MRMQNKSPYPPEAYFDIVLRRCPKAALLYKHLWKNKNADFCILIDKRNIHEYEIQNMKTFNHNLWLLNENHLINFFQDKNFFNVELTGWTDDL